MRISARRDCLTCAASKRLFPSVPILVGSLVMLGWAAHALDADEIVTRHTEALGGKARLAALQSLRLVGKITFGSGDFSIDLAWTALLKGPGMIREEASLKEPNSKDRWLVGNRKASRSSISARKTLTALTPLSSS